jgi:enoyl-CoA hydratase/carnithine racemase
MSYETIETKEKNGTGFIYFNRENYLNTVTAGMVDEIMNAMADMKNTCRSIVIGGRKNFSAGADVKQFQNMETREAYEFHIKLNSLALYFRDYNLPIISFLNGYVLGGGLELSLSTDIRICGNNSVLGQPEINLGINAGAGGNVILPQVVGRNRALYMILTGEKLTAKKAYEFGLVDILSDDPEKEAARISGIINGMPEQTVSMAKRIVNNSCGVNIKTNLDYEAAMFGILFSEKDTKEKINKFLRSKKE